MGDAPGSGRHPSEVRPVESADLDEVARIWHLSAMDAAASPMPSLSALRDRIDRALVAGRQLFVAQRGAQVVGLLAIKPAESILDQIFVLPDDWRNGVGTDLLAEAKRRRADGFVLRMAAANRRAGRFYEEAGLLNEGGETHPISGIPMRYFRWTGRTDRPTEAWWARQGLNL